MTLVPRARGSLRAALAIQQRLADANPAAILLQNGLAGSHHNVGVLPSA